MVIGGIETKFCEKNWKGCIIYIQITFFNYVKGSKIEENNNCM